MIYFIPHLHFIIHHLLILPILYQISFYTTHLLFYTTILSSIYVSTSFSGPLAYDYFQPENLPKNVNVSAQTSDWFENLNTTLIFLCLGLMYK